MPYYLLYLLIPLVFILYIWVGKKQDEYAKKNGAILVSHSYSLFIIYMLCIMALILRVPTLVGYRTSMLGTIIAYLLIIIGILYGLFSFGYFTKDYYYDMNLFHNKKIAISDTYEINIYIDYMIRKSSLTYMVTFRNGKNVKLDKFFNLFTDQDLINIDKILSKYATYNNDALFSKRELNFHISPAMKSLMKRRGYKMDDAA